MNNKSFSIVVIIITTIIVALLILLINSPKEEEDAPITEDKICPPDFYGKTPNMDNCAQFYICLPSSRPTLEHCPNGQVFDPESQNCVSEYDIRCGDRPYYGWEVTPQTLCHETINIYQVADPNDCTAYYLCPTPNEFIHLLCSYSFLYDIEENNCSYKDNVDCINRPNPYV